MAFANDWQWLFGIPLFAGVITGLVGAQTARQMTITGNAIADGVIAAFAAFVLTWALAFAVRFFNAPVVFYETEKARGDILELEKKPRLTCNHITIWNNSDEYFIRVQLQNLSAIELNGVKPYLDNIEADNSSGQLEKIDFKLRLYSQERWRERFVAKLANANLALPINFSAKQGKLIELFQIKKFEAGHVLHLATTGGRETLQSIRRAEFKCSVFGIPSPIEFQVIYEERDSGWQVSLINEQGNKLGPIRPGTHA
jgi:hypothetical protein